MNTSGADSARRRRFDRLIAGLYADMYRYAAWLSRDPGVAEEVVQEALLRAWKALDALKDDGSAKAWLLTIVRRENARYFERRQPETVDIDDLTPAQSAMLATPDDADSGDVRAAIFKLEDDYREPLVLQVLMGHSTQEIADFLGVRQGAVLTRLHRARQKLKSYLEADTAP